MARKISGGKYKKARKKKLGESLGQPRTVKLGKEKKKEMRLRGGNPRIILLSTEKANVFNPKTKKTKTIKIKAVLSLPSSHVLKNKLIKGAVIETELGKAKITNRPTQESSVQAILIP